MKIFAIRDEEDITGKDLAYLFYYENDKKFYIELREDADPWELPLLLDSFAKKREMTVDSYWSEIWVRQRIIPPDRQNIGEILRDNHLESYDEYGLLLPAMGRCAQDSYYLAAVRFDELPEEIRMRFSKRVEDALALEDFKLLVFFRDETVKKCDMAAYFSEKDGFGALLENPDYFKYASVMPGGFGISWDININVSAGELYRIGTEIPLTAEDFRSFAAQKVVNVAEAADMLGCTRQNIDYLTRSGKLRPIKTAEKAILYMKSDIQSHGWQ